MPVDAPRVHAECMTHDRSMPQTRWHGNVRPPSHKTARQHLNAVALDTTAAFQEPDGALVCFIQRLYTCTVYTCVLSASGMEQRLATVAITYYSAVHKTSAGRQSPLAVISDVVALTHGCPCTAWTWKQYCTGSIVQAPMCEWLRSAAARSDGALAHPDWNTPRGPLPSKAVLRQ